MSQPTLPTEPATQSAERAEDEVNRLLASGRFREAFDRYFDDDVVMQENDDAETRGKEANRLREKSFYDSVIKLEAELLGSAVHGDSSYSEWRYVIRFKSGQCWDYRQVAARRWRNGKVVHERFYHSDFPAIA